MNEGQNTPLGFLERIPPGWRVMPLRRFAQVKRGTADKSIKHGERPTHLIQYTDVYYKREQRADADYLPISVTESEWQNSRVRSGDILVTGSSETIDDIGHSTYVHQGLEDHVFGSDVLCVRPQPGTLVAGYGKYLMENAIYLSKFAELSRGVTRFRFSMDDFKNIRYAIPPRDSQLAITNYLDSETARIDSLIGRKQRFIDLLLEKRTALITTAVTKGLDPNVGMTDCGISWVGRIPRDWRIMRLRRVVRRFVDYRGQTPAKTEHGVPLVTARNVSDGRVSFEKSREYVSEDTYEQWMTRGYPEVGDVILTTEAPLGSVAQIDDPGVALAQRIILFKVNASLIEPSFLRLYFLSLPARAELEHRATGSTALGIKASHLRDVRVVVPPLADQLAIVSVVNAQCERMDVMIRKTGDSILLLREYRTALISAAVTGQIDIPGTDPTEEVA